MKSLVLVLGLIVAAPFTLSACRSSLESTCREACGDLCETDPQTEGACHAACATQADYAEKIDCEAPMEEYVACVNDSANRCSEDGPTECAERLTAYTDCYKGYCNASCTNLNGSNCIGFCDLFLDENDNPTEPICQPAAGCSAASAEDA